MKKERHVIIPASYLVLIKENKILLLRRFNTGYEDGKYSMVAGHVDPNETFTNCIIREAKEEAGIIIKNSALEVVHVMHRKSIDDEERIDIFLLAKNYDGEIENKEPNKCDDLSWFDLDNLPENTILHIKEAITNIKNKKFYSEYNW
jgi:8-oxo-dGTP diphosphatase